jgi:RNA polymerase sigma-70 factor, ECF subfamily
MHRLDEDDLLSRLSQLVQNERGQLAALARAEGVTPEDAVDCVQEALCTWLDAARGGRLPAAQGEHGSLLAGMVRNAARNRRRRHFRARPHDALGENGLPDDGAPRADDVLARAEDHVRLRLCVDELCAIQKAVVTLRMLEERPGEDVARALGISAGHVAVLLHRAKASLRACMTS